MTNVDLYADGSSKGTSDGPGGYGTIVKYRDSNGKTTKVMEYTEGFKVTTNNRMELMAVICGLESLTEPCNVSIYSDSKYVTDAFNQDWIGKWVANNWRTSNNTQVKNVDLWERLIAAKQKHLCKFIWIKGHAGHPENERCDYLGKSSSDGIKFTRNPDGTLSPERPIDQIVALAETPKESEIKINGVRFIVSGKDIKLHPDEKGEKAEKTLEKFNAIVESIFKVDNVGALFDILINTSFDMPFESKKVVETNSPSIPEFHVSE